jgi:uncharacterized glyoxalase superfamily protein PhnB
MCAMGLQPSFFYLDPKAAIRFLQQAFGFELTLLIEGEGGDDRVMHSELKLGSDVVINVGGEWAAWSKSPRSLDGHCTSSVRITIDRDIDAHCAHARAAGAVIAQEPETQFYGDRIYRAADPEGHMWTFSQHVRDVPVAEMEAAIGQKFKTEL